MWQFTKNGYHPRHIGRLDMAAAAGIAFARGMEVYFNPEVDLDQPPVVVRSIQAAHKAASDYLTIRLTAGGVMGSDDTSYVKLADRLTKAITKFAGRWQFPPGWHSFKPELVFPNHGNARADLLCQTDLGPCIIDFKTKVTRPQPYVLSQFISGLEHSWQFYHYIWAARQMGIPVRSYAVCVVSFEPWQVDIEEWVVDENYMDQWEQDAWQWWDKMLQAETTDTYIMSPDHTDRYGMCRYSETCLMGDRSFPSTWGNTMIKVERT